MPSPFPGMDPYLEHRHDWRTVHAQLIVQLQRALHAALPPGFVAKVESALTVETPGEILLRTARNRPELREPDVTVFQTSGHANMRPAGGLATLKHPIVEPETVDLEAEEQRFVRVYDRRHGGRQVVALIELLSPTNKDGDVGSSQYIRKQGEARAAGVHLLEIDLLRYGKHVAYVPKVVLDDSGSYDYLITLADTFRPLSYLFWRVELRDNLPTVLLPLTDDVPPVAVDLQSVLDDCYDAAGLGDDLDYTQSPEPPLSPNVADWADGLLRAAGLR